MLFVTQTEVSSTFTIFKAHRLPLGAIHFPSGRLSFIEHFLEFTESSG